MEGLCILPIRSYLMEPSPGSGQSVANLDIKNGDLLTIDYSDCKD